MVFRFPPSRASGMCPALRALLASSLVATGAMAVSVQSALAQAPTASKPARSAEVTVPSPRQSRAQPWPGRVEADYRITFNGFDIGGFAFKAQMDRRGYLLTGDTDISALLGAIRWVGATRAMGALIGGSARPNAFTFTFDGTGASGAIRVAFDRGNVTNASSVPPRPVRATTVPLQPEHTRNVLDPLSALLALARPRSGEACRQHLAVFDGQQRFDLKLSPRGGRTVQAATGGDKLHTCAITYVPIGGYEKNGQTMAMAASTGLEITLREVASAGLLVPARIRIPTGAGPVELAIGRLDIVPPMQHVAIGN